MADLFLNLLNASISASYLVLAVAALRLILKKAPKWVFPVLWGLVALRLIFPISIESVLSLVPSAQPIPADIAMARHPAIDSGIPVVNQVVNPVIAQSFTPDPVASANPLQIWLWLGGWGWLAGMGLMLLYTLVSYLRLRHRVRTAVRIRENQYQCDTVASPFVLGLFRPRIYLPYGIGEQDIFYIVAHEQAHIRRRDHWWKPLGFTLLAIHWFNPLMWLAYILLCRDIELACDEKVIKLLGREGRADYSQALLTCSVSRRSIAACPLAFGEVGVKARVKSVLSYRKPTLWIILAALVSSIVLAVCFLTNPKEKEQPTVQPGEYRASEIMYSTIANMPDGEIVKDLFECQLLDNDRLLIRGLTENGQAYNWIILGQLESCEFSNETLESLIVIHNNWLSGSAAEIGKIVDAYSVTEQYNDSVREEMRDSFVIFCTEDGQHYFAKLSVFGEPEGDGYHYVDFICYLAKLVPADEADAPLADGSGWGVTLSVEKSSPTGATVLFEQSKDPGDYEFVGGNDYMIQKFEDGTWTDLACNTKPVFLKEGYTISNIRRHEIDWEWLYGELSPGYYRIGKTVTRRLYSYPENETDPRVGESAMVWGTFSIDPPVGSPASAVLDIDYASSTGASICVSYFFADPIPDGTVTGDNYVLQKQVNGVWTDMSTLKDPNFGDNTYFLLDTGLVSQQLNWSELYGALPDGRYRLGKPVWIDGEVERTMIYTEFYLRLEGKPLLTAEDVLALAEQSRAQKRDLTWAEFEDFAYVEEWAPEQPEGFRYRRNYAMDGSLYFSILGESPEQKDLSRMYLLCEADDDLAFVYMRRGEEKGLQHFVDIHSKPLPEGQTDHWGITLKLDNVTPAGADVYYDGIIENDLQFEPENQYRLQRKTATGAWEFMPILDDSWDEGSYNSAEFFQAHRVNWEERYGILEPGTYRFANQMNVRYGWSEGQHDYTRTAYNTTLMSEFTINAPYIKPDDASLVMTAQEAAPDHVVVKFGWYDNALPEAYYRMAGYTVEKLEGDTWKTVYENAPGEPYAESRIDLDWYHEDPRNGLFLSWESIGALPDGIYRIGQEIATSEDLSEARRFMVYAEFEINTKDWENGVMPLREVPEWYSPEDAERDGYVVMRNGESPYEQSGFTHFAQAAYRGEPAYVRVATFGYSIATHSQVRYIQDLDFDGEKYILRWLENGQEKIQTYRYLEHNVSQKRGAFALTNYENYVLSNQKNLNWEQIRSNPSSRDQMGNYFAICNAVWRAPLNPVLPWKAVEAELHFEGETLLTITDPERVERLQNFLSKAEYTGFEPKTHSVGVGLDLVLTSEEGVTTLIELDPNDNLCRIDGEFCQYGVSNTHQVAAFWEYLGIEAWPDAVYEKYPDAFRENP